MASLHEDIDMPEEGAAPLRPGDRILEVRDNASYQDVLDAPEGKVAELIHGKLYLMSRPGGPHTHAASVLGMILGPPFHLGRGGPGGWLIYGEPELHLITDIKVFVPDLAGWLLETLPMAPDDHKFTLMPDWVCEVLSPSTRRKDLELKLPEYGQAGVPHVWVVDPLARTLEAYERQAGSLELTASLKGEEEVSLPPFDAVPFNLGLLWV